MSEEARSAATVHATTCAVEATGFCTCVLGDDPYGEDEIGDNDA